MNIRTLRRLSTISVLSIAALLIAACNTQVAEPAQVDTQQATVQAPFPVATGQAQSQAATTQAILQPVPPTGPVLGTLELAAIDLGFTPNFFNVDEPGRYTIKYTNKGQILHDVSFTDGTKIVVKPGETQQADVMIPAEGVKFICSIPGHKESGMVGTISVGGKVITQEEEAGGGHGGPAVTTDVSPDPNAPAYTLHNPAAPALLQGEVHDIDLVIKEMPMTVAKGFVQSVWTFGGAVPGPAIRVKVGDTVRIHLKNPAESKLPHSVDFHASMVAWNDEMTSINPGEEKLYEWKADYAGVWMYHCGTAPALHHIANGMYGMVIVEPKEGLPPVDKEFAFVQSEWYLGPQGEPASLTKAAAAAPAPDFVAFNGVADQYKDNPIQIETGKKVRAFVLNAGPSIDSSFHIVGTIFDTVIKEGVQLTPDNPGRYGSQAVDLAPAQGAIVEFTMAEDGLYPIVTHAFNFVGRGALGLFKAGDGDPKK
jgi:nitrite reductase (NO-forming)